MNSIILSPDSSSTVSNNKIFQDLEKKILIVKRRREKLTKSNDDDEEKGVSLRQMPRFVFTILKTNGFSIRLVILISSSQRNSQNRCKKGKKLY